MKFLDYIEGKIDFLEINDLFISKKSILPSILVNYQRKI